jgi:predicted outer membrane protein
MIGKFVAPVCLLMVACSGTPRPGTPEFARDHEAHAFSIAANLSEIEEAQLAASRGMREDVRVLGQHLIADHARALAIHDEMSEMFAIDWGLNTREPSDLTIGRGHEAAQTRALPAPPPAVDRIYTVNRAALEASAPAAEIMHSHDSAMAELSVRDGAAFDQTFIKRQVEMHRYLITRIDEILPSVTTPGLRNQLQADRAMLEGHLRMVESVRVD